MIAFIVFIGILSLLVLVHEFGHFIVARKNGVKVHEFGLGIPPKVWGKKIGETEYTLNLLPFGGFVRLEGEDSTDSNAEKDPENFLSKTPLQRGLILVAGVMMNLVLAFVLYYGLFAVTGFKSLTLPLITDYQFKFGNTRTVNTIVSSYVEGSAGKEAGIQVGEAIVELDGQPVYTVPDIRNYVSDKSGKEIHVTLVDMKTQFDGPVRTINVTPKTDAESGKGVLGVYMTPAVQLSYDTSFLDKLMSAPKHSYNVLAYSFAVMKELVKTSVETKNVGPVSEGVSGPVGIYSIVGALLSYGGVGAFLHILDFIALMSLSLALMNILPFPALDGGRLVFVVIEALRGGKKINLQTEANIHKWGMLILLFMLVLVSIRDVGRVFF